ncbi:hypothetical protein BDZ89DRAFT_1046228 [Hymenopellis radicata]|nr:hypothetical protein BDZ89DRAFT_1046228 [Hymenopellis radicata]
MLAHDVVLSFDAIIVVGLSLAALILLPRWVCYVYIAVVAGDSRPLIRILPLSSYGTRRSDLPRLAGLSATSRRQHAVRDLMLHSPAPSLGNGPLPVWISAEKTSST